MSQVRDFFFFEAFPYIQILSSNVYWFYLGKITSILITTLLLTYEGAVLNQLKMWPVQRQRLDQIGPMSHMGPGLKKWLVQYLRLDQIGPMSYMGPGPISDIGPGPMWHMGLAYYWQVRPPDGLTGIR